MMNLGWFSTGRGEGSRGLLRTAAEAIVRGELDARILFVWCNRDPGEEAGSDAFMAMVKEYGIPLRTLSSQRFRREHNATDFASVRADYDREVMTRLADYAPQACILAGYGLIFGSEASHHFPLLNLHPALPGGPIGTWQQVIWQLIEARAQETGSMVHLATEALDRGPPLAYVNISLSGREFDRSWRQVRGRTPEAIRAEEGEELPLFRQIRREMVRRERPLLLETLKALATGRIRVVDGVVVDGGGTPLAGVALNEEVNRTLAAQPREAEA